MAALNYRIASELVREVERPKDARHYTIVCDACGARFEDDGSTLQCVNTHEPGLLRTEYEERTFKIDQRAEGLYRYRAWLPSIRNLSGSGRTVTYRSDALSRITELPNLWIAFNGYWPEKDAWLATSTFKELEAFTVLSRRPRKHDDVLVVASAGNTAAAFARACSLNNVHCLIVVPEFGLQNLQFSDLLNPCVKIVSIVGFTDYCDAMTLADRVSSVDGFLAEGGVRNIARRDGLGTTMLNAVEAIGRIPDYYFQAIGSGAGAIAVYEAAKRLIDDGGFGNNLPRLMLSQNLPFVPIYTSWKSRQRDLVKIDAEDGKKQIQQIAAHVLSNRKPPYSIKGGVFDVLNETEGDMLVADNIETLHASRLFEQAEGIDIDPASGVAFATLMKAVRYGQIEPDATVLLNITGGGRYRSWLDKKMIPARPDLLVDGSEITSDETLERIISLFR